MSVQNVYGGYLDAVGTGIQNQYSDGEPLLMPYTNIDTKSVVGVTPVINVCYKGKRILIAGTDADSIVVDTVTKENSHRTLSMTLRLDLCIDDAVESFDPIHFSARMDGFCISTEKTRGGGRRARNADVAVMEASLLHSNANKSLNKLKYSSDLFTKSALFSNNGLIACQSRFTHHIPLSNGLKHGMIDRTITVDIVLCVIAIIHSRNSDATRLCSAFFLSNSPLSIITVRGSCAMSILGSVPFHQINLEPLSFDPITHNLSTFTRSVDQQQLTRPGEITIIPWLFNAAVSARVPLTKEQLSNNSWVDTLYEEVLHDIEQGSSYVATSYLNELLNHVARAYLLCNIIKEHRGVSLSELREFDIVLPDKIVCCVRAELNPETAPISQVDSPIESITKWLLENFENEQDIPSRQAVQVKSSQKSHKNHSLEDDDDDGILSYKQVQIAHDLTSDEDDNT